MSSIEILDRRGKNKVEAVPAVVPEVVTESKPKGTWKSVGYMIVLMPSNAGPIVSGRAVGLRSDELFFIADYLFAPIVPEHFDWTAEAKKRLDTFLECDCNRGSRCAIHQMYIEQWKKSDVQRIELVGNSAVPEAIEVMMKAEQSRKAAGIVAPRG